jgi:hypothetical protein
MYNKIGRLSREERDVVDIHGVFTSYYKRAFGVGGYEGYGIIAWG